MPATWFSGCFLALAMAIPFGVRVWLCAERSADLTGLTPDQWLELFVVGARLDAVTICWASLPMLAALLLLPQRWWGTVRRFAFGYAFAMFALLLFSEIAGIHFFRYYDFRPNYLVIEHGLDPMVLRAAAATLPIGWIGCGVAVFAPALSWVLWRLAPLRSESPTHSPKARKRDRLAMLVVIALVIAVARGTLDLRPINPSLAAITHNRVANEIAGSSVLNVLDELVRRGQGDYVLVESVVAIGDPGEAVARVRDQLASTGTFTEDSPNPLVRRVAGSHAEKRLNVVVVIMESFTAQLVGALGGSPALSPQFDALASQGVLLANLRATGERTVQGLEAVLSSFPPLPGVSVVRRPQARHGFTTLASVLAQRDYETLFFYGGQGIFDSMRGFFVGNGFDRFIDQDDMESPDFRGLWGVSDEDLFRRADREFRELDASGRPFVAAILTVSLHSPWEYPADRIRPLPVDTPVPAGFSLPELDNFRYADYALGEFIRMARDAPYFDDTLFVLVGDHGVHLRGRALIPIDEYQVPALFLAPRHLAPLRVGRLTSQLDIAPTIMGILGGAYRSPFFGTDVLANPNDEGSALVVYRKRRYGSQRGDRLVVFGPDPEPLAYARDPNTGGWGLVAVEPLHREQRRDAAAMLQTAEALMIDGRYITTRTLQPVSPSLSRQRPRR
ncbi:MAG: LTA synthase family protein [Myxococcota bacterium]